MTFKDHADQGLYVDEGYGPGVTREDALDKHLAETLVRVAELTEMLTAATDTALQRGKQLDQVRELCLDPVHSPDADVLACDILNMLETSDVELDVHWRGGHPWSADGG